MFENSQRVPTRSSDFSKPDSPSASTTRSSFRPIREGEVDKEHDAGFDSNLIESEKRKPSWSTNNSTGSLKEGDEVNVRSSSFRSSTTLTSPNAEPVTETSRTNVSCVATPTVDRSGKTVIQTITKTDREINGQPLPTETIRAEIPMEQIPSLKEGGEPFFSSPLIESSSPSPSPASTESFESQRRSPSPSLSQPHQRRSSLKETASHAASNAIETGSNMVHQAKEWVHDHAPKVKEELNPTAAKNWASHQWDRLKEATRRLDSRKLKSYLPRKEILPLLGSVFLAILLGSYLYRNADRLGLKDNPQDETLVPLQEILIPHSTPSNSNPTPPSQPSDHFTAYPANRDYYQHEHIPRRLSELEEKLAETAKAGLPSASSSRHSTDSKSPIQSTASDSSESLHSKLSNAAGYVHDKVGELGEKMKEKVSEGKEHLSGYASHVQHEAQKAELKAESKAKEGMAKGKETLRDIKEKATEISDSAKNKINQATHQAKSKINEAYDSSSSSSSSSQHQSGHLSGDDLSSEETFSDFPSSSPSGEGPYDEPNTPPHSHTYEHTLKGAAEYLKDTVGEGLHALGKRSENTMPQPEPF